MKWFFTVESHCISYYLHGPLLLVKQQEVQHINNYLRVKFKTRHFLKWNVILRGREGGQLLLNYCPTWRTSMLFLKKKGIGTKMWAGLGASVIRVEWRQEFGVTCTYAIVPITVQGLHYNIYMMEKVKHFWGNTKHSLTLLLINKTSHCCGGVSQTLKDPSKNIICYLKIKDF